MSALPPLPTDALPLSWRRVAAGGAVYSPGGYGARWLALADVPAGAPLAHVLAAQPGRWFVRGCRPQHLAAIQALGGGGWCYAQEALIPLQPLPHLAERERTSVRSGVRQASIQLLEPLPALAIAEAVYARSLHARQPRLRHLYRQGCDTAAMALLARPYIDGGMAAYSPQGQPWAAITWVANGSGLAHLEQMVRAADAPNGVMEALIWQAAQHLAAAGWQWFSLGEAPFVLPEGRSHWLGRLVARAGHTLLPGYHARGLWRFKRKFCPVWVPIYMAGRPAPGMPAPLSMMVRSRAWRLLLG